MPSGLKFHNLVATSSIRSWWNVMESQALEERPGTPGIRAARCQPTAPPIHSSAGLETGATNT